MMCEIEYIQNNIAIGIPTLARNIHKNREIVLEKKTIDKNWAVVPHHAEDKKIQENPSVICSILFGEIEKYFIQKRIPIIIEIMT
jgi:hypothetical protein